MIQLELSDIKDLNTFIPQEALSKINKALQKRLRDRCNKHQEEFVKICHIDDPEFEEMSYGYKCGICGIRLKPIKFVPWDRDEI